MRVSFLVFILSFSLQLALMVYYVDKLYSVRTVESNYPLNVHGWIVYLNRQQHGLLSILETVTVIAAGIASIIKIFVLRNNSDASGESRR